MARRKHRETEPRPVVASLVKPQAIGGPFSVPQPWLLAGMTALFVARPLFPSESAAEYGDGLIMVMLWLALAIFWLLGAVGRPTFTLRFGWTDAAVLILIGWYSVSAIWAVEHAAPRPALNMLWEWIGMGLCFLLARQLITTEREARAMTAVMVALAVALAGYGLYQRFWEMPQSQAQYAADPDRAMRDAGLWFPPDSPARTLFESRLENREPMATFALTNSLAAFLAPWLVVLVGIGVAAARRGNRVLGMLACGTPIAACLLLTKSRSGYIAAAVGLLLIGLSARQRKLRLGWKMPGAAVVILAILIGILAMSGLGGDLLSRATKSFGYRVQYWQSTLQMIADHPIIGCGPGNFQNAYTQYKLPEASEEVADPHNFFLEIWSTAGTPAALAFAMVLACFGWRNIKGPTRAESDDSGQHAPEGSHPNPSPAKSQLPTDASPHTWKSIFIGAILGFFLSIPVGMIGAAPSSPAAVLVGLPLAIGTMWLFVGWVRDGHLPRTLLGIGVIVLLVDLLAAGGIGLPSVAGTLWVLMAVGLVGLSPRILRPWSAWAALLLAVVVAVACYHVSYNPVMGCQRQMARAEHRPAEAAEHLEAAAAADPWATAPWRQLALFEFDRWWQHPDKTTFEQFQRASNKTLELAPNSALTWRTAGEAYLRAFSKTDEQGKKVAPETCRDAVDAYRQAVRLYPNNASYRAEFAEACRADGDETGFRREAEAALRLDGLTPHSDKKLPEKMRLRLALELGQKP